MAASLLDSILASMQAGNGATGILGSGPTTQSKTDAQSQAANQAWLDALMGATQGVQKDPYSSPSMLGLGQPYGVQGPSAPAPAPPAPPPMAAPQEVAPVPVPQGPMPPAATIPAPAMPPEGAMPVSMPVVPQAAVPVPAPAAPAARPSMFGGLNNYIDNNRATLMALAGGLASGGIGQGFSEAAKVQALNQPKFGVIGHDIFGQPQMGWINTQNQTIKPATAVAGGSGGIGGVDSNKPIYSQLPKAQQDIVDSMLAGRKSMPGAMALKTPYWNTLIAAAHERASEKGGAFDEAIWAQKLAANKDLSPQGKSGQTINALDTVQGHIEKLSDAVEKLDNSDWAAWNALRNAVATNTPLDPARAQKAQAVKDAIKPVLDEMSRAYKGGHMSDTEIKSWGELISSAGTKTTQLQAISDFVDFLNTKRQALINQYGALDVPFKGANAAQNEHVTKLVHDRNLPAVQNSSQAGAASAQSVPPPEQRAPGVYDTPKGKLRWTGTGWVQP